MSTHEFTSTDGEPVTRFDFGTPSPQPVLRSLSSRVVQNTISIQHATAPQDPDIISRSTGGSYALDSPSGTVREIGTISARVSGPIKDGTVVEFKGLPMTAKQAVDHGAALVRGEDGIYREQGAQSQAGGEPPQQEPPAAASADTPEPLKPEVFTAHEALAKALPEPVLDASVARIIEAGSLEGANLADVEGSGMNRAEFVTHAQAVISGLQTQANTAVEKHGAEPDAFYAWARQADPEALRRAMTAHYHSADPAKAYGELLHAYFKAVPPSIEALKAGGYEAWRDPRSGEPMVRISGQVVKVKAAAKSGLF